MVRRTAWCAGALALAAGAAAPGIGAAATLTPVSGLPDDARVMALTPSPSGNEAMVTTLLGGRVAMFAVSDVRAPVPLGTRKAASAARGRTGTRAFISTDGLVGAWSLPRGGFRVVTVDGNAARTLRAPGAGGPSTLWLAPGGNVVIARRGAAAGVWRAGPTGSAVHRVRRPAPAHLRRIAYAVSPSGDGFGSCADAGVQTSLASIRARSRSIADVLSPKGLRIRPFGRCAASDSGRAVAALVADRRGRGEVFATLRDEPRVIRLRGLRASSGAHMAFIPRTTRLVVDSGDARCRGRRVWIVNVARRRARALRTPAGMCGPASVASGGTLVAVRRRGGLLLVRVSDGRVRAPALPAAYARVAGLQVSADGSRVTYLALSAGRGADLWSVASDGSDPVNLAPDDTWIDTTRTFLVQSLDGSHAWTNVVGPRRDPLSRVPVAGYARTAFVPPG